MLKSLRPSVLALPFLLPYPSSHAQEMEGFVVKSPISFSGIAQLHTLRSKGKNYTAKAVYPTFRSRMPLARFTNTQLRANTVGGHNKWIAETKKSLQTDTKPIAPYEYTTAPSLSRFRPARLISLSFQSYQYMGGAHGMPLELTQNYGIVGGRPKELSLGDFFRPGTNYRASVESKIFAKLKKDKNAMWVQDGTVKNLTTGQFNNFTVSTKGLTWIFNPYEMGPYAVGMFEITLSPGELGPGFRREMMG